MTGSRTTIGRRELLLTGASAATLTMLPAGCKNMIDETSTCGRNQPFDCGWRFHRSEGQGFDSVEFDDSSWRGVDLPHDWSIEDPPAQESRGESTIIGPFDRNAKGDLAVGFTVGGEGWYRKRFRFEKPTRQRVEILFEGVYMNSDVWLNGQHLGTHPNGYTPFAYDLTSHLAASGDNVLVVRVRNLGENSRWYSGSGIYRHVWLDVLPAQARIARWGVGVVTRRIADGKALIEINTRVEDVAAGLTLVSRVRDQDGRVVTEESTPGAADVKQMVSIASPRLWSPEEPALYTLETELRRSDAVIDRASSAFGVRIVTFDAERGMTINGAPTKLRGGCIHHDNGVLGAMSFDAAEQRKVQLLKARGYNAIRASHNPYAPAFLRACDEQGMFVIAEAFDAWNKPKTPQDYAVHFDEQWRSDLTTQVLSGRNHPSIIMWSIGNEIPGRNTPEGMELQWKLANEVHRLDETRPVTAGLNGFIGRPAIASATAARAGVADAEDQMSTVFLDVAGYNYKLADYEADHQRCPRRILYGSESFAKDVVEIWNLTEQKPWLIGDFVWVAMDYLGEAGMGGSSVLPNESARDPLASVAGWPWICAFSGDIDLIGQQKSASRLRDVVWGLSELEVAVQRPLPPDSVEIVRIWGWSDEHPNWTWPGAEGRPVNIRVYTRGDQVDLRLNGRMLDSKSVAAAERRVEFTASYQPGVLEAVAYRNGTEIARRQLSTMGAPAAIRLTPDRSEIAAARSEIAHVCVEIVDLSGNVTLEARHSIEVSVSGPAELIALGTASPLATGSFRSTRAQAWNGRALAILRSSGSAGRVQVEARSEGLSTGSTALQFV